jgi:hypothetical protein
VPPEIPESHSYDELFNYLSQLAWYFRETEIEGATRAELLGFNKVFCERFTAVDLDSRLELLITTRLLTKRGDSYEFAYPYIYYFFLGRWLARNLDTPGMKDKIESWCDKLYLRRNSSALIFLSYHSNSGWIIESIFSVLDRCFTNSVCLNLSSDIDVFNALVNATARVLLGEPDVPENQERARQLRDRIDELEAAGNLEEKDDEGAELVEEGDGTKHQLEQISELNLLLKTAEILGQIVKNYYGSIERERKEALLRKVIEAPLRFLRSLIDQITVDPNAFVSEIEKTIAARHPGRDPLEQKNLAKRIAFQLVGMVTTGLFLRVASWIASKRIEEDIHNVVEDNNTVAFRLVETASRLVLPREVAHDELRRLARDLRGNVFAFKVLQGMGVHHLHLFHVKRKDKQRLCETLKIEFSGSRFVDLKTKDTKILNRRG